MSREFAPIEALPEWNGLPPLLTDEDGNEIKTPEQWMNRREALIRLVEHYMLGQGPAFDAPVKGQVIQSERALDGQALLDTVRVFYGPEFQGHFDMSVLYKDDGRKKPAITWSLFSYTGPCPVERELVLERGYVLCSFYREQMTPDAPMKTGPAQAVYPEYDWGAIRIWAFQHSLAASYLTAQPYVNPDALVATGHSRGGKAALAAGILDPRFAVTAPNNSGCGGCGNFRFLGTRDGLTQDPALTESLGRIAHVFPYWWNQTFQTIGELNPPHGFKYESRLPFDGHTLRALIAPRALFSSEGLDDAWANPYGSQLSCKAAQPVFDLMGVPQNNRLFLREGPHQFGETDWRALLDFCDQQFSF